MANLPRAFEEIGEGFLRQREQGALRYAEALEKETARKAGELKVGEDLRKAMQDQMESLRSHTNSLREDLAALNPEPDEDNRPTNPVYLNTLNELRKAQSALSQVEAGFYGVEAPAGKDYESDAEAIYQSLSAEGPQKIETLNTLLTSGKEKRRREAIATITQRMTESGVVMPEDQQAIQNLVIQKIQTGDVPSAAAPRPVDFQTNLQDDPTIPSAPTTQQMGDPTEIPSAESVMKTLDFNVPQSELPDLMERTNLAKDEADQRATVIENYVHSFLQSMGLDVHPTDIRKYMQTGEGQLIDSSTGQPYPLPPQFSSHIRKYRDAWQNNDLLRGKIKVHIRRIQTRLGARGMAESGSMFDRERQGLIAQVDRRTEPEEFEISLEQFGRQTA
jgi:hypothetical protein